MQLTIEIDDKLRNRLDIEASKLGVDEAECARRLVEQALKKEPATLSEAIQMWIDEGDEEEQRETFEALRQGLNESHSSYRKIFP